MGKKESVSPRAEYSCARDKLRDEMAGTKKRYVQVVGEFLTEYLLAHPEAEAAILKKDKSIDGSLKEMEKAARKEAVGGCGILDDATAFGIVLKYFGIEAAQDAITAGGETPPLQTREQNDDPFDLDALLAGL